MTYTDSGLRWCVAHGSPHRTTALSIGRIPAGASMCVASIGQAWRALDGRADKPTACRHVALLVGTEPVTTSGQGALL